MQYCHGCDSLVAPDYYECPYCGSAALTDESYDGSEEREGMAEPCEHHFKEINDGTAQCIYCGVIED